MDAVLIAGKRVVPALLMLPVSFPFWLSSARALAAGSKGAFRKLGSLFGAFLVAGLTMVACLALLAAVAAMTVLLLAVLGMRKDVGRRG